jgi:hypothetical protein
MPQAFNWQKLEEMKKTLRWFRRIEEVALTS